MYDSIADGKQRVEAFNSSDVDRIELNNTRAALADHIYRTIVVELRV